MVTAFKDMMARHARPGVVTWIGLRPARREELSPVESATIDATGLIGDHGRAGKRAVTLIQAEHVPVIEALLGMPVRPAELRRNLLISGINLVALKGREVALGTARLRISGPCHPCSRMEEALGAGGYSAMRGHGGVCAEVTHPGAFKLGDAMTPL